MDETPAGQLSCSGCTGGVLRRDRVSMALWRNDDLIVIEDIPALVCQSCGERYFEDETAMALDMMRGAGGAGGAPVRTVNVPVYSYTPPGSSPRKGGET